MLTLTGMVKRGHAQRHRIVPKDAARLFIAEHLTAQKLSPADLAAELDTTEATISRWINGKRSVNQHKQRAIEEVLNLPPGGLARRPTDAPKEALLAGLSDKKKEAAMDYIGYLRTRPD